MDLLKYASAFVYPEASWYEGKTLKILIDENGKSEGGETTQCLVITGISYSIHSLHTRKLYEWSIKRSPEICKHYVCGLYLDCLIQRQNVIIDEKWYKWGCRNYSKCLVSNVLFTSFCLVTKPTKPTKWHVRPAKTHNSLSIRPVWSESSLSAW